jgi:hypothetical protein
MGGSESVSSGAPDLVLRARIDCRELTAKEVLVRLVPHCLRARAQGMRALILIENLELLSDSVTRLLKSFDRLSADFPARIVLAESSGFGSAFRDALSGHAHLDLAEGPGRR